MLKKMWCVTDKKIDTIHSNLHFANILYQLCVKPNVHTDSIVSIDV